MTAPDWHDLIAAERLPQRYAEVVERWWVPLADALAERARDREGPLFVGVSGAQGSGKSTLCRFLQELLAERGLVTVTLSLDDFYLPHADRQELARTVHPLLATRGVPGTHDVPLIEQAFAALAEGSDQPLRLPRFDKASDDRLAEADWPSVPGRCQVVLFEGWCIGARPGDPARLAEPINVLERDEDPDLVWRRHVQAALAGPYAALWDRLDLLVALLPPGFAEVRRNRALQESKLGSGSGPDRRMDAAALDRFLAHYERITLDLFAQLPETADFVIRLGPGHSVLSLEQR